MVSSLSHIKSFFSNLKSPPIHNNNTLEDTHRLD